IDDIPFSVNLRVNIDARNQESIFALIDDLDVRGLGGKTIGMYFAPVEATTSGCSHVSDLTMTKSDYASLETALFQYAYARKLATFPFPPRFMGLCGALRPKALVVTPSGDVHKCWDTVSFPHQRVGSILDTSTLESNPLNAAWNAWTPFANSSCRNCKILPTCTGSCAYKFVHASETQGEAAVLPCPSWKFSIKERLLQHAHLNGFITAEQIPPGQVTDPNELCCFEPTGPVEGLPDKILAAKAASYARAGRRVIPLPVLAGPREAAPLIDAAVPAW
ncbi:MAG TPA: SPASM domain-containing protein, partial [Longimicrobium sp.]|nr:SPASM domain-containing protein [Longimicrobium sp.]